MRTAQILAPVNVEVIEARLRGQSRNGWESVLFVFMVAVLTDCVCLLCLFLSDHDPGRINGGGLDVRNWWMQERGWWEKTQDWKTQDAREEEEERFLIVEF
ncbi:MAG: hypothetical protein NTW21_13415 [Verrucomicrobia bacterium]|nr:hypothetical protein [Verrucomicrobiota bacterium]